MVMATDLCIIFIYTKSGWFRSHNIHRIYSEYTPVLHSIENQIATITSRSDGYSYLFIWNTKVKYI